MLIELSSRTFRNLESLPTWRPSGGAHLILGANGAGKSSLLEAIYLLTTTRSFRTAQLADCVREGEREFHLKGEVDGAQRLGLGVGWEAGARYRRINGKHTPLAEHLQAQPVVAWTAADQAVLGGPPLARRRLIDQGLVSVRPGAVELLSRYRQTLDQKRGLLARGGVGLDTWNDLLSPLAAELIGLRQAYVSRLGVALEEILETAEMELPPISLRYRPSPALAEGGADALRAELDRIVEQERRLGRPLIGPHRDELEVRWDGREARRVASGGERKALGLILTAARGRLLAAAGREPIYLLDDVDSELDQLRLRGVVSLFSGAEQLFATSSREETWRGVIEAETWVVKEGRIVPR